MYSTKKKTVHDDARIDYIKQVDSRQRLQMVPMLVSLMMYFHGLYDTSFVKRTCAKKAKY